MAEKKRPCCPKCKSELLPTTRGIEQSPHWYARPDGVNVAVCRCPHCVIDFQIPFDQFPDEEDKDAAS